MNKQELQSALANIRWNYLLGRILLEEMPPSGFEKLRDRVYEIKGSQPTWKWPMNTLCEAIRSGKLMKFSLGFEKSLRRALLSEPFDIVTIYCGSTKQKFSQWDHFEFARLIRISTSHGKQLGTLTQDRNLRKAKECKWRDVVLTPETTEPMLSPQHAIYLLEDLIAFVDTLK